MFPKKQVVIVTAGANVLAFYFTDGAHAQSRCTAVGSVAAQSYIRRLVRLSACIRHRMSSQIGRVTDRARRPV